MPVKVLRFFAGCAIGFVLWRYGTPLYATIIAPITRIVLRSFASLEVDPAGMNLDVSGATIPTAHIPFSELTYNVILFLGLFATLPRPFRARNLMRFALASLVLFLTHVLATASDVMFTYATRLGAWSDTHFSGTAQDFWTAADYLYRIGGMFGIAFVLWYFVAESPATEHRARPQTARGRS